MSKRIDFDAALDEQDEAEEPLEITLFKQDWDLPGTVPAAVTLRIAAWYEDGLVDEDGTPVEGTTLTGAQCLLLLRDMVPPDMLAEWCDLGLSTDKFAKVVDLIMKSYRDKAKKAEEEEGKAPAPKGVNRQSRRSSNAGRSSRPTSPASTGSRSPKR